MTLSEETRIKRLENLAKKNQKEIAILRDIIENKISDIIVGIATQNIRIDVHQDPSIRANELLTLAALEREMNNG